MLILKIILEILDAGDYDNYITRIPSIISNPNGVRRTSGSTTGASGRYYCVNNSTGQVWYTNNPNAGGNTSGGNTTIVSGDISWKIWCAVIKAGFSENAAAGVLGNIQQESDFEPTAVNGSGASGLAQWMNPRLDGLKKYANSKGKDWTDADTQIEYLISEILGDGSNFAEPQNGMYPRQYNDWVNATSPEDAAIAFLDWFERAGDDSGPTRASYAKAWYNKYHGQSIPTAGSGAEYANASAEEKVRFLFPNGIPQSESELEQYLIEIEVPTTSRSGVKGTTHVMVHKAIAQDVYDACKAAQDAGFKIYEIGGYREFGTDSAGKSGGLSYSQHCYGLAVDINSTENGEFNGDGTPTGNWWWRPGTDEFSITEDSALVQTFKSKGWGWGGNWRSKKDYMHFSFMGT